MMRRRPIEGETKDKNSYAPLVSIVIPSYNQKIFLEKTIQSAISQDYQNIEIFIMDGGSTDGSVDLIRSFEGKIAHWRSGPDGGQVCAIQEGLSMTKGSLLTFINSDDILMPNAVSSVVKRWRSRPNCVLYGDFFVIDDHDNIREKVKTPPHIRWIAWQIHPVMAQPGTFFTRDIYEAVGGVDTTLQYAFDLDLWMRFMRAEAVFLKCNAFLSAFRRYSYQKGHSKKWLQVCLADNRKIHSRYSSYRGGRLMELIAKTAHTVIQIVSLNSPYSLFYRIFKEHRVISFTSSCSD